MKAVASIGFAIGLIAAPVAAQNTGMDAKETRLLVASYGDCVVKKQQQRASQAILADIDNGELMRRYPQLVDGRCMPVRGLSSLAVRFTGGQYRYALADALVRKELALAPAPTLNAVPRLTHHQPQPPSKVNARGKPLKAAALAKATADYQEELATQYLSRYGECVVRADPAAARALLLAKPETPGEAAQFRAMATALGTCLPPGETLRFGKLALRGTIAANYYRLAHAAQTAATAGASQ